MDILFCLDRILTDFRDLFNTQNFVLFLAFLIGLITTDLTLEIPQIVRYYRPGKLTQGLQVAYLRLQLLAVVYSASSKTETNAQNIPHTFEQDTALPLDKVSA